MGEKLSDDGGICEARKNKQSHFEKGLQASPYMSVCPSEWNNSAPTGRIFMKFDIYVKKVK